MSELRDPDAARAYVAAGLCVSRLSDLGTDVPIALPWLLETLSETGSLPPAGIIADLGHLFSGRSLRSAPPLPQVPPRLKSALRCYEDHVLGRIEAAPEIDALTDAFLGLPPAQFARGVAIVASRLLRRLNTQSTSLSPGAIRNLASTPTTELQATATAGLSAGAHALALLEDGYRSTTQGAHRAGNLISETDIFLIEHIGVLADLTQRLAIEDILASARELKAAMPRRMKARKHAKRQLVATEVSDDDRYPTGGFSGIATSGTLENLVSSELIYMDDGRTPTTRDAPIDLFDLRYVEGELLYYTRDDSQFIRDRRVVDFFLSPGLVRTRIKSTSTPRQQIVELFGLLHCVVDRLCDWLSDRELHVSLVFVQNSPLASERALCKVLFADWIERGVVEISCVARIDTTPADAAATLRADYDRILVGTEPTTEVVDAMQLIVQGTGPAIAASRAAQTTPCSGWEHAAKTLLHMLA